MAVMTSTAVGALNGAASTGAVSGTSFNRSKMSCITVTGSSMITVPATAGGALSYQWAWSLFRETSGGLWTLHRLRHSALTHLGEDGVSAPLLMTKSRHQNLRTLSRYVRPGTKAVAQLTAEHDPARRGKHPRRWSCHAQKRHDPGKHQVFVPLLLGPFIGL